MPMRPQHLTVPWWITLCLDGEPVTEAAAMREDGTAEMAVTRSRAGAASWRAVNADGVLMADIEGFQRLFLTAGDRVRFPGFTVS